jgi:hypothetical protein
MTTPTNWHHLWVGDDHHGANWKAPAVDHFNGLNNAGFEGDVVVGLVGGFKQRQEARAWLNERRSDWILGVVADEGFEMVTLNVMHQWAKRRDTHPSTPVLYTHGKGSFQASLYADCWRKNMIGHLVGGWRECVKSLHSVDAVGCHWLTPESDPEKIDIPMFGGNFWWANAGFVAALPPIGWSNRWEAEGWLGKGNPTVKNLVPGWPVY